MENINVNTPDETTAAPTVYSAELVVEEAPKPAPKKKKKANTPSDKTIIKNLRKDVKDLEAKLAEAEEQLAAADSKAEIYFSKYNKLQNELNNQKTRVNEAKHYMAQTIMSSIASFEMSVK